MSDLVKITDPDELQFLIDHQGLPGVPLLAMPRGGPASYFANADELNKWRGYASDAVTDPR